MLRMPNVPLSYRSMSSTSNVGLYYPSSRSNFVGTDGSEGMIDNGAHQYTTVSGLPESAPIEPHQDWLLQRLKELTAVKANIDAELRELLDLFHKRQYALAQRNAHSPFTDTTTTTPAPYVPFPPTSPSSPTNIAPNFVSQTVNLSPIQGEMWNIPNDIPPPTTTPHARPATPTLPKYTVHIRAGKKVFRCECGHEASRKGDMKRHRESLWHAKRNHICSCGKSFTRRDSLLRHANTYSHTPDSRVFLDSIFY